VELWVIVGVKEGERVPVGVWVGEKVLVDVEVQAGVPVGMGVIVTVGVCVGERFPACGVWDRTGKNPAAAWSALTAFE
jgi:hypothetical protein